MRASAWTGRLDGAEADAHRRLLDLDFAKLPLSQINTDGRSRGAAALRRHADVGEGPDQVRLGYRFRQGERLVHRRQSGRSRDDGQAATCRPQVQAARGHAVGRTAGLYARARRLRHAGGARAPIHPSSRPRGRARQFGATWKEIQGDVWAIGAERMKEGEAHAVPLSSEAIALLGPRGRPDDLIFQPLRAARS